MNLYSDFRETLDLLGFLPEVTTRRVAELELIIKGFENESEEMKEQVNQLRAKAV